MYIEVQEIRLQNFLSYGRDIDSNVLTFENGVDIISAPNGSGKSTFVDGICYAFFGKPYRKIKVSSLQNNINTKELRVEVKFKVNGKDFKIIRGMNPSIFEIYENDSLLEEESTIKSYQTMLEENIICTSEEVFRNLIVLGAGISSSKSFLDLSAKEKEEIFNCLIDTKIFQELTDASKRKINEYKTFNTEYEYKDNILRDYIESEKTRIEEIKEHNKRIRESRSKTTQEYEELISKTKEDIEKINNVLVKNDSIGGYITVMEQNVASEEYGIKISNERISSIKEKLLLIESAEKTSITCKDCGTTNYTIEIDEELLNSKEVLKKDLESLVANKKECQENLEKYSEKLKELKEKKIKVEALSLKKSKLEKDLEIYTSKLNDIQEETELSIDTTKFKEKHQEYKDNKEKLFSNKELLEKYKLLNSILDKDNLRGQVISQAIPFLNKEINSFIEKFSIMTFNLIINKDFKESIVSRNCTQEYHQLSNGQKFRLTFAVMFGFLKLMESRSATHWNILVLDEALDSSLDFSGREDLLNILKYEFSDKKDIIVISHNQEIKEKEGLFSREINISKDKFSKITILN